jgi:hypothetical protein
MRSSSYHCRLYSHITAVSSAFNKFVNSLLAFESSRIVALGQLCAQVYLCALQSIQKLESHSCKVTPRNNKCSDEPDVEAFR